MSKGAFPRVATYAIGVYSIVAISIVVFLYFDWIEWCFYQTEYYHDS